MIDIKFIPESDLESYVEAVQEYEKIWKEDGARIIDVLERHTGLNFKEDRIGVVVYEGISNSGHNPKDVMKLRASNSYDVKKGTLVHELGHRILFGIKEPEDFKSHYLLDLFLYEVYEDLYGKEFVDMMVEKEKSYKEVYVNAWDWALSFSAEERRQKLMEILRKENV